MTTEISLKPGKIRSRKKRIILQYFIWVVFPGLILGYMAYRGIMNDEAIREKEGRIRMESLSRSFFGGVDSLLYSITAADSAVPAGNLATRPADPSVRMSFLVETGNPPELRQHNLLFLPPAIPAGAEADPQDIPTDSLIRLRALLSLASEQNRLGRFEEACTTYRTIRDEYSSFTTATAFPPGLSAGLELARTEKAAGNRAEMKAAIIWLLKNLANKGIRIEAPVFDLLFSAAAGLAGEADPAIDSLVTMIGSQKAETKFLLKILANPELISGAGNPAGYTPLSRMSCFPLNRNGLVAVYNRPGDTPGSMVYVISLGEFLAGHTAELITNALSTGSTVWSIRDAEGKYVAGSDDATEGFFSIAFPDHLPGWSLCLREVREGGQAGLLFGDGSVYVLVFLFIVLMMIFGLVFTLYTFNQEIQLNKLKSEFISNVSHELKSPLTSIRQHAELLTQERVVPVQKPEYYQIILDQSEHLSHLVENILDFSRMEDDRKRYRFVPTDLGGLVERTVAGFNTRQIDRKPVVRYAGKKDLPDVWIDAESMEQALYNLTDNAIKFSEGGGTVEVTVAASKSQVVVNIADSGIGISKKDLPHIFERFYRGEEGREKGIKGSGIGLTLVKRIVEAHGGNIGVTSKPGEGTVFSIQLPINQSEK